MLVEVIQFFQLHTWYREYSIDLSIKFKLRCYDFARRWNELAVALKALGREKGVTLIEVLVVIGIAAILAAILVPALLFGLRAGKISACANNLHQLQMGVSQYLAENNGTFPPDDLGWDRMTTGFENGNPINIFSWSQGSTARLVQELAPYGVTKNLIRCPLDSYFGTKTEGFITGTHKYSSYLSGWSPFESDYKVVVSTDVVNPSKWCMIQDTFLPMHDLDYEHVETVHGNYGNAVFGDGHLKAIVAQSGDECRQFWKSF